MSISAYDLLKEIQNGATVYEDYNRNCIFGKPRKRMYLVRPDKSVQVIQRSCLRGLDDYLFTVKIGSRLEWRLRLSQEIGIKGNQASMFDLGQH